MATGIEVLRDGFERVAGAVRPVPHGLDAEQLAFRVDGRANSIAWLLWHLTRVQDDHVADAAGSDQVWTSQGWVERFGLPLDDLDTGYGHGPDEVGAVRVGSGDLLVAYFDDVHARTLSFLDELGEADLDRIVDESWDPPVTLSVRLMSVISDDLQHAGQAALVRGIVRPR